MNKLVGMVVVTLAFGTGVASANNGILFDNPNDPYFTTPAEFIALGQRLKGKIELERRSVTIVPAQNSTSTDPARSGQSGK